MALSPSLVTQFYENEVPAFVEAELESLYGSVFSSMPQFRVYGGAENASTYVARDEERIKTLFLYQLEGQTLRVLNEGMALDDKAVREFADAVFSRYPHVSVISFRAVRPSFTTLPLPYQRFQIGEDIALDLPGSVEEYRARLSKSTRQHLNYYQNRLKRRYPDFQFEVTTRESIREADIRAIIAFNRLRMANKNKVSSIDEAELQRIIRLSKERGMVCVIKLDGKICAGSIRYHIGDTFFARANAHDPSYDDDRIGTLCAYLTICECIRRGAKRFSFDHGQNDNKYRFLARDVSLENLTLYRSYAHLILNGRFALKTAAKGYAGEFKRRLINEAEQKDGRLPRAINKLRILVRNVRRIGST